MEGKVWFIEAEYKGKWWICHSYDFNFFMSKEKAEEFVKYQRDALPDNTEIRIRAYVRIEE